MKKVMLIWRRFGKEHGEGTGFQLNRPDVVDDHIRRRIDDCLQTPDCEWRWWQATDNLFIEKPTGHDWCLPNTRIYYLKKQNWALIENVKLQHFDKSWKWYAHIGTLTPYGTYHNIDCWLFTDMFVDVLVKDDNATHTVLDLDDLGEVLKTGLITSAQASRILDNAQMLINLIQAGEFPPEEVDSRGRFYPPG